MSRLDRFRFASFRRKKFVVILLVILSLVVFSGAGLLFLGVFGFRSELVSIALTEQSENAHYNGVGLNLDYIPNVNLIRNPSFEKQAAYYSLTVLDSDGQSVFFDPNEVIESGINTQRAVSSPVRIVSIDASGNMMLRYEGRITGFESARLGQISDLEMPLSFREYSGIVKTCTLQNSVTALTESGLVISDITSEQLAKVYDGGNVSFTDICCNGNVIYAVTGDGIIFTSADGKTFTQISSGEHAGNYSVTSCAASGSCLSIITSGRELCIYDSGEFQKVRLPNGDIPVMIGATDDYTVVVCDDGSIYRSANGSVYVEINTEDIYSECNAKALFCTSSDSYILNDDGSILRIVHNSGDELRYLNAMRDSDTSLTTLTVTDSGQIVASTDDKTAVIISETTGSAVTVSSEKVSVDGVFHSANNRVLFTGNEAVYSASVLSDFSMDNAIPTDNITIGDICFIETLNSYASLSVIEGDEWSMAPEHGVWNVYGSGTSIELTSDMYDGGNALRLSGSTDNIHAVSQKLPGSIKDNFVKDKFYRISLYMKTDFGSSAPDEIDVWLEGNSFGKQGLSCRKLNNDYNEYSTVFIVNDMMLSEDDISFNIAFSGAGAVLIDKIYVGPDSIASSSIPDSFTEAVKEASPRAIRFNNLGIGSNGFSQHVFFGVSEMSTGADYVKEDGSVTQVSDVRSFEASLRLARDAEADPWFVFGSFTDQETVNDILAYMCGSVSSQYGMVRINNGTALPWGRQFENIYIEVCDTEQSFASDVQRASFVDYVIGMITSSEYYSDVKDKIIFIDGMEYSGGTMLSSADAHSSSVTIATAADMSRRSSTFVTRLGESFEDVRFKAPRVTSGSDMGEFLSSVDFDGTFNFAQYMATITSDEAFFVEMAMINCKASFIPSSYGDENVFAKGQEMKMVLDMMALLKDMETTSRMYVNVADSMSSTGQDASDFLERCTVSQFDGENNSYLVITNTSSTLQQFVMYNGAQRYLQSAVRRYSTEGRLLTTKRLTNSYRRYNLQPGETIIVTINR